MKIEALSRGKNYWLLLAAVYSLYVFTFGASGTQSSLVVTYMMERFGASESAILLADTLRLCTISASMFTAGFLYRHLKLRWTLLISCTLWTVPLFLFPFLPSLGWLYAAKMIQGCNAPGFPLLLATILKWAPQKKHGIASAMFNGLYISGACLGSIAVIVAEALGAWYMSTVFLGVLAAICSVFIFILTRDRQEKEEEDLQEKDRSRVVYAMAATWLMVAAFSACNWVDLAVNTDLPVFAQYLGFSIGSSGSLMMIVSGVTLVTSLAAGALSDRVIGNHGDQLKRRILVFSCGFVLCIAAMFLIVRASSYKELSLYSVLAMAGVSWSNATFWAIPPLFYKGKQLNTGWLVTAIVCAVSMAAGLMLLKKRRVAPV